MRMRVVTLDVETTGLNRSKQKKVSHGHRIIEIGCVEIINGKVSGNYFHTLVNPQQPIDEKAIKIHGITNEKVKDSPRFEAIVDKLLNFISESPLVIHNAPFDIAFLDKEFSLLPPPKQPHLKFIVTDTLAIARWLFPGNDNSLNGLSKRYKVNIQREKHGALLDADILARIYIKMHDI